MAPKLYKMDLSPPVRTVYLAAKHLDIELDYIETNFLEKDQLKPEFLKLNPQHTIPTLDDGGNSIWDSHAIIVYLATKYGKDDSVYPKDPFKRAVIDQRLHFDSGVLFTLIKAILGPMVYKGEKTIPDYLADEVRVAYGFADKFLEGHKWVAGDNITLADFSMLSSITSLDCLVPINAIKFPNVVSWIKRAQQLPYYDVNEKGLGDLKELIKKLMS